MSCSPAHKRPRLQGSLLEKSSSLDTKCTTAWMTSSRSIWTTVQDLGLQRINVTPDGLKTALWWTGAREMYQYLQYLPVYIRDFLITISGYRHPSIISSFFDYRSLVVHWYGKDLRGCVWVRKRWWEWKARRWRDLQNHRNFFCHRCCSDCGNTLYGVFLSSFGQVNVHMDEVERRMKEAMLCS